MPATLKYPDAVRQQAILLHRQGKGYRSISSELSLPRDTVRSWIVNYKRKGQPAVAAEKEIQYRAARLEYESGTESLLAVAQKHGHNYYNLRNFLQQYHPESRGLHSFNKRKAALQAMVAQQIRELHSLQAQLLDQLEENHLG